MRKTIIPYIIIILGLLLQAQVLFAQDKGNRYTSHGLTVGVGATSVLDSYLSPLEYKGQEIRLQRETLRKTTLSDGKIYVQTLFNAHVSHTENHTGNGEMIEGLLNWDLSYLYRFPSLTRKLTLLAGPTLELNGGAIYNRRNSNNPAQAKVSAQLAATGMLLYGFHAVKRDFLLRYQATLPLAGVMFSPEYGESYYEIFQLKHGGHHVCLTTPVSAPSMRQTLSLDFPVKNTLVRVSYIGDIQQSQVNHIKSHVWSHAFLLGFVKNFQLVKPSDSAFKNNPFQL